MTAELADKKQEEKQGGKKEIDYTVYTDEAMIRFPNPKQLVPNPAPKLKSWDLYKSMGSPKHIIAPMVDGSELAWRVFSRLHGADLCYTPMINAGQYARKKSKTFRHAQFDLFNQEEGKPVLDRPLVIQFCGHDKDDWLEAASHIVRNGVCDAVDLNLGCPQGVAKRGRYGAYLMDETQTVEEMINHLHVNLPIPVTAKFRCLDSVEETVKFAKMLERAGAQIITLHGRTRAQKGQLAGLADWDKIKAVKEAVSVPVFANGNIIRSSDITKCLEYTKADGVMSAEGSLYNPLIFRPLRPKACKDYFDSLPESLKETLLSISESALTDDDHDNLKYAYASSVILAKQYLAIVRHLETETNVHNIKGHLFKIFQSLFKHEEFFDIRNNLGTCGFHFGGKGNKQNARPWLDKLADYDNVVDMISQRLEQLSPEFYAQSTYLSKEQDKEKQQQEKEEKEGKEEGEETDKGGQDEVQEPDQKKAKIKDTINNNVSSMLPSSASSILNTFFTEDQKKIVPFSHSQPYIRAPNIEHAFPYR